jgi:response regulator RpfG family c-di-GMP phosphodiesterase
MRVASSISHQMNCDRRTRRTIEVAARLHDVASGFCGSQALSKIKLDDVERDAVRRHPELGAAIVLGAGLPDEVAMAVRGHHERWDGSGYPDNLPGEKAPLAARIIAVAEVFDALISPRPWRDGMPVTDAMATLLQGAGTQFDPDVIQAFFAARKQPTN